MVDREKLALPQNQGREHSALAKELPLQFLTIPDEFETRLFRAFAYLIAEQSK